MHANEQQVGKGQGKKDAHPSPHIFKTLAPLYLEVLRGNIPPPLSPHGGSSTTGVMSCPRKLAARGFALGFWRPATRPT